MSDSPGRMTYRVTEVGAKVECWTDLDYSHFVHDREVCPRTSTEAGGGRREGGLVGTRTWGSAPNGMIGCQFGVSQGMGEAIMLTMGEIGFI